VIDIIDIGQGRLAIKSPSFSETLRRIARETPGMKWNAVRREWEGYRDAVTEVHRRCLDHSLLMGPIPRERFTSSATWAPLDIPLRDYQAIASDFLVGHAGTGALLADDVGLGKSMECIAAARSLGTSTLIVCPSFVRGVWAGADGEIKKWWPEAYPPAVLSGTKPKACPPASLVTVCHYDILHAWADYINPETVIFDECQFLISEKSRRSGAAKAIARRAKYRIAASATPMTNRPRDLWNIVDTISEGRFGKPWDYLLRHCDAKKVEVAKNTVVWDTSGASNLDELKRRLGHFMLRRTKSDVSLQLPSFTRQIVEVECAGALACLALAGFDNVTDNKALREALNGAADAKLESVVDAAGSFADAGHNVVIWTYRRGLAEEFCSSLIKGGYDAMFVHGDVPLEKRLERIEMKPRVLCATIDSIGAGVSLAYSDVGIVAELSWEPHKLIQLEGRHHRGGQARGVLIQYMIAKGSADELVKSAVLRKLDTFTAGIGKLDDGLKDDLRGRTAVDTLKALYQRMMAEED
jgi:SWI/SNF-related matrix-associated actin-dependent regulator 1 of chromatin subfamily A